MLSKWVESTIDKKWCEHCGYVGTGYFGECWNCESAVSKYIEIYIRSDHL